ncbi:MAG: sugar phosphate isomerase/epimerase [Acidobacteriota bacterium]|nr:sugar phosphate isomerase/epimerase [Acidobacteriota bacterium]
MSSAAMAAPFAASSSAEETMPGDIKLGVATYSFREFQRDLCIKNVKALGIRYVDVKEFHLPQTDPPALLEAGRKAFDKAGLTVIGGGNVGLPEPDEAGLRKHFEYAKTVGFPMIVCAPRQENLSIVEKLAKEYNIKIAIHNHGPEDKHFPTPGSVLDAVKNMDPRMGLCMDLGHTCRTGADPVEWIAKAGPRLFEIHSKDLRDLSGPRDQPAFSQCPVGDGKIPFPAIFKQLRKVDYPGVVSLEYEIEADNPMPGMQKSFAYMRGLIAGLRG